MDWKCFRYEKGKVEYAWGKVGLWERRKEWSKSWDAVLLDSVRPDTYWNHVKFQLICGFGRG